MEKLEKILTPKAVLFGVIAGIAGLAITIILFVNLKPKRQYATLVTTNVTVIPYRSNETIITPTEVSESQPKSTNNVIDKSETGKKETNLMAGDNVIVKGTEGTGLRLRQEPGLNGKFVYLGEDGEAFLIIDGPDAIDGYIWWKIKKVDGADIQGWAVEDYLQGQQNP